MKTPSDRSHRSWLIALGAVLFLTVQLWMSWAVWQRTGNTPPEPDDSYTYITGIQLIAHYGTPLPKLPGLPRDRVMDTGMAHLTYNAALGLLARLSVCSPACLYFTSFFAGKVAMLGALLLLFSRFGLRDHEQAGALVVLGGYGGDPATHGFYWVVPSFWLLVAFLIIAALLLAEWRRPLHTLAGGVAAGILFSGLHPLSLWASLVLVLFAALAVWLSGQWRGFLSTRWPMFGGFVAGVATMAAATLLLAALLNERPSQSIGVQLAGLGVRPTVSQAPPGTVWARIEPVLPGAWPIWNTYFRFLIAQPYILAVAWGVAVLRRRGRLDLPLLWAAVILGVLGSTLHTYGARSVLFAWPLTYPLLAVGFLDLMDRVQRRLPRARTAVTIATVLLTLAASAATFNYSHSTVKSIAQTNDFTWDPTCTETLLAHSDLRSVIEYSDKYALSAFLAHGLLERPRGSVQDFLARGAEGAVSYFLVESPLAIITREAVERAAGRPLTVLRRCGFFTIYSLPRGF